jgi:hypothetical protein
MTTNASGAMRARQQYRLLARAQIDGAIREAGFVFTLADDEAGPTRGEEVIYVPIDDAGNPLSPDQQAAP